ncbi:carbonate dehydratase [Maribacter polysiphoniae]|uniref:Carbonic anhydrase 2 n=1 Tax=Maribacter polysiphoniae TaxID=429344 RepID=A0A316E800_9FLAO|nr:carbonate dehydratase [Maribacter polysiphoniae]MBD1259293.1 carbonate dehydratase [Maribacter polysiphoniae]PWK24853.1 carbonic anhydrase [Maribacter polysiphoniae]
MKSDFYKSLIENNKEWVLSKLDSDPEFFKKLEKGQQPPLFWIGCSDSRVPANEIIGGKPGEVFVHRNIANMVVHSDMNMLSVLDYAVNVLKIKHIIVCGHYGCGGVKAALGNKSYGLADNWIRHIRDVYRHHQVSLGTIKDKSELFDRFVEYNTMEQVYNLAKTSIVQNAWDRGQDLYLHGWVYGVGTGIVKDLDVNFECNSQLEEFYKLAVV